MWGYFIFVFIIKKKEKREKKKKKRKIVYEENKIKSLKFQFRGVVGSVRRIVGELKFI